MLTEVLFILPAVSLFIFKKSAFIDFLLVLEEHHLDPVSHSVNVSGWWGPL